MAETNNNIIDISLDIQTKKTYRINGDDNKIIELNPGDMGILVRYEAAIPKFDELLDIVSKIDFEQDSAKACEDFKKADGLAKELVNEVFNYDVCSVCIEGGSMFDTSNGVYRFEELIDKLFALYDDVITKEQKAIDKRIKKHTDKYIPTDHKKKS